jgi:lipid-binding SYLF domain-containing protein
MEATMRALSGILVDVALALVGHPSSMAADTAAELSRDANAALKDLYARAPLAKSLGPQAHAILVFPKVVKAGLGVGGQYGEGALIQQRKAVRYYNTAGASLGLQAGAQQYGYAMFFIYAFVFGQKGLMAGLGIQGNKITKINPK